MTAASVPSTQQAVAPLVNDDGALITRGRIKDVSAANSLYSSMWDSDRIASRNRARIDSMFDGGPPKNVNAAIVSGQGFETQINWGDGEEALHQECAPYYDLTFSQEVFGTTPIKRDYPDDETRTTYGEVIAEEITNLLKGWDDFIPQRIACIREMKKHGVAFVYREDDVNWMTKTSGMEFFKIPRPTQIGVKNIRYCGCQVDMDPEDLYAKIKNPEIAKLAGYNVEACRQQIMKAAPTTPLNTDWEYWERFWKNNDYMMSYEKNVCPLIFFWCQELDGTISQYLFPRDGGTDFLYKRLGRLPRMGSFIHAYIENVGTNTDYHSIRGLGSRLYPRVQTYNRKLNSFSDLVDFDASPIFQPDGDVDDDMMATSQSGPYIILNPNWKIPEKKGANYSNTVIPAIQMFSQMINQRTSKIGQQSFMTPDGKTDKHQFQAQMEQQAQLSDSDMELYLSVWENEWQETVRRITRKGYLPKEPGGQEVADFYRRCKERDVPPEAIQAVDWKRCKINRGLGAGSAAARVVIFDRIEPEIAALDPISQEKFRRMKIMAIGGVQLANELAPPPKDRKLPTEASLADLQNNQLIAGEQVPVRDGQNHIVIASIRLEKLAELNQMVAQGGDPVLVQVVGPMHNLLEDMEAHLERANPNDPLVRQMLQVAQQFNMMVTNGLRHVQKLQQNAQREMAHNAGKVGDTQMSQNGAPTPQNGSESQQTGMEQDLNTNDKGRALEQSIRLQQKMDDLNFSRMKNEEALTQSRKKFAQDSRLADLKAAADLRRL